MTSLLYQSFPELGLSTDFRFVGFPDEFFSQNQQLIEKAYADMSELEQGSIANPDENRMVGHYWLRNAELAPSPELRMCISDTLKKVKDCARKVMQGELAPATGKFEKLLIIGIGGSALGPQFVEKALANPAGDALDTYYFDNTDPGGMDAVLSRIGSSLSTTLVLVISKSGGTPETRNGMIEAQHAFSQAGLNFSKHAIAVTGEGSKLYKVAKDEKWLDIFPMWDWVGGRTSETAVVGLLPAALQGFDIDQFLKGAAHMDNATSARGRRSVTQLQCLP